VKREGTNTVRVGYDAVRVENFGGGARLRNHWGKWCYRVSRGCKQKVEVFSFGEW